MLYSLSQVAVSIAAIADRPDAQRILTQIRGLHHRGHIQSAARNDQGHHLIDEFEAVVAALLAEALDQGLEADDLVSFEATLRHGRNVVCPTEGTYPISLEANLPRIEAGERWVIEVTRQHDPETGEVQSSPNWVRLDGGVTTRVGALNPDPLTYPDDSDPIVTGVLTINAAVIARRLLSHLRAAG
jgi:hypothetical protein